MKLAKVSKALLAAATLVLLGHNTAFADAVLSVVAPQGPIFVGQQFTVSINVTGPTVIHNGVPTTSGVTDLDAFQFDIAFNCSVSGGNATSCAPGAGILSAISVTEGSFLPDGGSNITFFQSGTIDNNAGLISLIGDVGASGVDGSGTLVNITFQALTKGTTSIAILANSDLQFYDSDFDPIVIDNSVTSSSSTQTFPTNQFLSTSVVVTPEPSSVQLMLLGAVAGIIALTCTNRRITQSN
jgi:hypothetical protein